MKHVRIPARLRGHRPRYADVAATLALLFAMGGTAYAATSLGPNTVGTVQLKDNSVTNPKIATHAIGARNLSAESVNIAKLADDAVDTTKIEDLSVTHSKLFPNSVDGSNVANDSLSLDDLLGISRTGAISFNLGAGHCGTLNISEPGAQVGQLVLFAFTGSTAVPTSVTFGGAKVASADHIEVKACNVGASNVSVTGLGIHVATFG